MATHRINASQLAWINNYDGTAKLALKVSGIEDAIELREGDQIYVTVRITQGRLSLKELIAFVQMNENNKKQTLNLSEDLNTPHSPIAAVGLFFGTP